jgi:hypothetical protein
MQRKSTAAIKQTYFPPLTDLDDAPLLHHQAGKGKVESQVEAWETQVVV